MEKITMNNLAKTLYELRDKLVEEENPCGE